MSGQTLTEKILAGHAGRSRARPGEILWVQVDLVMSHDLTMPSVLDNLQRLGDPTVFDRSGVCIVMEHVVPSHTVAHANMAKRIRDWADRQGLRHFYDMGSHGIVHVFLPEMGIAAPGQLILGADSHSCTMGVVGAFATGVGATDAAVAMALGETWLKVPPTIGVELVGRPRPWITGKDIFLALLRRLGGDGALYKALEFSGAGLQQLGMDSRATLCNMAIEAGAKSGIVAPDSVTRAWLAERPLPVAMDRAHLASDPDAEFDDLVRLDLSEVELTVSAPPSPDNVVPLGEVGEVHVDQVFIGTCTNGRLEDLRIAASILKGRKVARGTRLIVVPASQNVLLAAMREGLTEVFVEAGAIVGTPGCGPCHGLHMGPLADGDIGLYTANRNFPGRQGGKTSRVYLAGPAVAAATAVAGHIAGPETIDRALVPA